MRAYAHQAGDHEFAFWAGEIKLRAERKAGELLSEMEKHPPGPEPEDQSQAATDPPMLKDLDISKSQSSRWQQEAELSDREYEIMRLLGKGHTVNKIADMLSLSNKTVSTYKTRIMDKMSFKNSSELIQYLIQKDLI